MLKTIFFDLDNTFINSKLAYYFALEKISEKNPWFQGKEFVEVFEENKKKVQKRYPDHPLKRNRLLVFKEMSELYSESVDPKELLKLENQYFKYFGKEIKSQVKRNKESYKKLYELLEAISQKYSILLISNESLRTQLFKLSWFWPKNVPFELITSEEFGIEKPDPRIFKEGLSRMESKPDEALMIGDSFEDDVHGAWNAGIEAIHLKSIFGQEMKLEKEFEGKKYKEYYNINSILEEILDF